MGEKRTTSADCNVCVNEIGNDEIFLKTTEKDFIKEKPNILLHSCCGPCSTAIIERLAPDYNITVYFYNPNITNIGEYNHRKESQLITIEKFNNESKYGEVKYIEGPYDTETYLEAVKNNTEDKEGGPRCTLCFDIRLDQAAKYAMKNNFDVFATTLAVSPHKPYELIGSIGKEKAKKYGVSFLNENFKKKGGFQRSTELSKKYGLYRQNFCGCEYSRR